ncbi:hypothetical protein [Rhodococcus sp. USK13]|uniref:hypothetical protein n=1 Tax=Rhodococcus sp. USK13 TaxID=2806442 RepID=UPI001BCD6EA8|nr:hypothetical protein [Rhodococcus sp. USK13]
MIIAQPELIEHTPLGVLRGFEVAAVLVWLFGAYLVYRFGATKFLLGIYAGTTAWFMWDWIFTDEWFLNLSYDRRSLLLFTLDGRPEPLWSPMSYGFFFGIAALIFLRYEHTFRRVLGRYIVVAFPVAMALFDLVVEGFIVSVLDIYQYGYRDEWKIWGIPYTNMVWVILIQALMVLTYSVYAKQQHSRHILAVHGDPTFRESERTEESWLVAVLTFSVAAAAVYVGTTVIAFVLSAIDPWT